jgi:hypothetical protein
MDCDFLYRLGPSASENDQAGSGQGACQDARKTNGHCPQGHRADRGNPGQDAYDTDPANLATWQRPAAAASTATGLTTNHATWQRPATAAPAATGLATNYAAWQRAASAAPAAAAGLATNYAAWQWAASAATAATTTGRADRHNCQGQVRTSYTASNESGASGDAPDSIFLTPEGVAPRAARRHRHRCEAPAPGPR